MASTNLSETVASDETCTICLEQVEVNNNTNKATAKLSCGHIFHLSCIGCEFNAKGAMRCPNCRKIERSDWLYTSPHADNEDIIPDVVVDLCPPNCTCHCHGGHGAHGARNHHAVARETRGRNTRGNGSSHQLSNVQNIHRHQHNFGSARLPNSFAIPSSGANTSYGISARGTYHMYPPLPPPTSTPTPTPTSIFDWYGDRHQNLTNRLRSIHQTMHQDRRNVRQRLTTTAADNQLVNLNTRGWEPPTTSNANASADTDTNTVSGVSLQLTLAPPEDPLALRL